MARPDLTFGDIAGKLHMLRVECTRCPRKRGIAGRVHHDLLGYDPSPCADARRTRRNCACSLWYAGPGADVGSHGAMNPAGKGRMDI